VPGFPGFFHEMEIKKMMKERKRKEKGGVHFYKNDLK